MINLKRQNGSTLSLNPDHEIDRGGESIILPVPSEPNKIAKIYLPGINPIDPIKFGYLTKLDGSIFIKPQELLWGKSNVEGFLMDYLDHKSYFQLFRLSDKTFCNQNNIDIRFKISIAEKLIAGVDAAHKIGIVIGDLNPYNIMFNVAGDLKFIDVDSYETPGSKHSGRMLEDIRDYYSGGNINKDSDYFALSILIFNILTYIHPFKGVHKKYKKISDRIAQRITVFDKDADLIVPKIYQPIGDKNLVNQFFRVFKNSERFLLSMHGSGYAIASPAVKPKVGSIEAGGLLITSVVTNGGVDDIFFLGTQGVITTNDHFLVYDTRNKGYMTIKRTYERSYCDNVYVGNNNIIIRKGSLLYISNGGGEILLKNFEIPIGAMVKQYNNILLVVDNNHYYTLNLDSVMDATIKMTKTEAYGPSFKNIKGVFQIITGRTRLFYEVKNTLSSIDSPIFINDIYQVGNYGMVSFRDGQSVVNKIFKIKNHKIELSEDAFDDIFHFTYKDGVNGEGFIFMPKDDVIEVYRTDDLIKIYEIKCIYSNTASVIYNSDSGLILLNDGDVYLLNKK